MQDSDNPLPPLLRNTPFRVFVIWLLTILLAYFSLRMVGALEGDAVYRVSTWLALTPVPLFVVGLWEWMRRGVER